MPYLEDVTELAEHLADLCGVYSQGILFVGLTPEESRQQEDWIVDHADACQCRMCWCGQIERRIRAAVAHEQVATPSPARRIAFTFDARSLEALKARGVVFEELIVTAPDGMTKTLRLPRLGARQEG